MGITGLVSSGRVHTPDVEYAPGYRFSADGSARRWTTDPDLFYAEPASSRLTLTTPDGGGHITHPSVLFVPGEGFAGYRYWMAATPYDGSDSTIENPCIYQSMDGSTWTVPAGLTNPITAYPGGTVFNSDTHLILSEDGNTLYCLYRAAGGGSDILYIKSTADGFTWSSATTILTTVSVTERILSPAVFWDGSQYVMYYVDSVNSSATVVKRRTCPTLTGTWSSATTCTISLPATRQPWHIDAHIVNSEIWLLIMDNGTPAAGGQGDLYLLTSSDGTTFDTAALPVIPRFTYLANLGNYRSCMVPMMVNGDVGFDLFYSCISTGGDWGIARSTIRPKSVTAYDNVLGMYGGTTVVSPYLAGDTFNRSDGASLGTSDSGHTWTVQAGVPGVSSRKAYASTVTNTKAVIDGGSVNGYFEVHITAVGTQAWLMFRGTDASNYYRLGVVTGIIVWQKVVAGVATTIWSNNAFTSGRVGARCNGDSITVFRNGVPVGQTVDSFSNTGTLFGIQTSESTSRFDNIWCRSLIDSTL